MAYKARFRPLERLTASGWQKLEPTAVDPFQKGVIGWVTDKVMRFTIGSPAVLYTFVLAGEEIPDGDS